MPFAAAIGCVKAQWPLFIDAGLANMRCGRQVALADAHQLDISQIAVYLVGAGKDQRRLRVVLAQRLEQRQRASRVDLEVAHRLHHAGGDRHLAGQVEHRLCTARGFRQRGLIAHIRPA